MNLLGQPIPMNEFNQWKAKYQELVGEFERNKSSSTQLENLLLRVVIRLTMAARGLDPRFDSQLMEIIELLRKGVFSDKIRNQLDELSNALLLTKEEHHSSNLIEESKLLFKFLNCCLQSVEQQMILKNVQERVEQEEIKDVNTLFVALLKLPIWSSDSPQKKMPELPAKTGLFAKVLNRTLPKADAENSGKIDVGAVRDRICLLLDAVEIPAGLGSEAENIRNQLRMNEAPEAFLTALNEAIDFIAHVKSYVQSEQQAFESFLATLTEKLGTIEKQAIGVSAITQASVKDKQTTHETFSSEVERLRSGTRGATDIDQLKNLVTSRLEVIVYHLTKSRDKELDRLQLTEQQLSNLAGRLRELEEETQELHAKVHAERDLALRDALTSLPNRMAYEERVMMEVARWRRFLHPLTLLVWDVDFFKSINDRFGHQAGDKCLVIIGQELLESIRSTDFVAR
jgi:diguanylate cyclase